MEGKERDCANREEHEEEYSREAGVSASASVYDSHPIMNIKEASNSGRKGIDSALPPS